MEIPEKYLLQYIIKKTKKKQLKDSLGVNIEPGHIEECWTDN